MFPQSFSNANPFQFAGPYPFTGVNPFIGAGMIGAQGFNPLFASQYGQGQYGQGLSPFGQGGISPFGQGISPFGQGSSPFGQAGAFGQVASPLGAGMNPGINPLWGAQVGQLGHFGGGISPAVAAHLASQAAAQLASTQLAAHLAAQQLAAISPMIASSLTQYPGTPLPFGVPGPVGPFGAAQINPLALSGGVNPATQGQVQSPFGHSPQGGHSFQPTTILA